MNTPDPCKSIGDVIQGLALPTPTPPTAPPAADPGGAAPATATAAPQSDPEPETWEQEQARRAREERAKQFREMCPTLYRQTDPARLPPDRLAKVLAWNYGPKGLLLVGPTGTGKTRCAWLLVRRLFLEERRRVMYFDGIGWGISVAQAYGEPDTTERWLDRLCRADVLFFDDLFKAKMTEAQEQALYGVFERRAAWLRPIIATMNSTGDMILARMTDNGRADRGEPLLRRMREFCEVVSFGQPARAAP